MAKNTDQIKRLTNTLTLAGVLAELDPMVEGEKDGIKWLSFKGVIQCGDNKAYNMNFRTFAREVNSKGEKSKLYTNAKEWYKKAVSLAQCGGNESKATWFEGVGGVLDNMYWSPKYGRVVEGHQYSINLFNDFTEYKSEIILEGYVNSLTDETEKADPSKYTGRQRVTLLSRDSYNNIVKMNFIVPNTKVVSDGVDNMVKAFSDYNIEKGSTFLLYSGLVLHESANRGGGVGVTYGKSSYTDWMVVGFNNRGYDEEENCISPQMARKMMNERQIKIDSITSDNGSSSNDHDKETPAPKNTKKVVTDDPYTEEDFDDMPF